MPETSGPRRGASRFSESDAVVSVNNIYVIFFNMNASELIRSVRLNRGWTQTELARRMGTPQSAIARWERGGLSPRIDTLERILHACGFQGEIQLIDQWQVDHDQLQERLSWSPAERLQYLMDMVAFEERARRARRVSL